MAADLTEEGLIAAAQLIFNKPHKPSEVVMNIDDARALGYEGAPCHCDLCGGGAHFHWRSNERRRR